MVKFSLSNVNLVDNRLINSSPDVLFHNLVETLDFRNTVHDKILKIESERNSLA